MSRRLIVGMLVLAAGALFGAYRYFSADLPSTARLEMIEPTLKIANPMLYIRTRPNMSPSRPNDTTSTADTTRKPMNIHSR